MLRALLLVSSVVAAGLITCVNAQVSNSAKPGSSPELQTIVSRMEMAEQESRAHAMPYSVTRDYQMATGAEKPSSEVLAKVSFTPPGGVQYAIERTQGSSRGEKVVRSILDHEAKLAADAARDGRVRNAVNEQNYNFSYLGEQVIDGQPSYVLRITPKHAAEYLIDGRAYVDAQRYQIREIDGLMSKSPSWWLKSVHVTMTFGDVHGMWLQNSTRAVADVRLLGEHTLTSRALNYEVAESVAQNRVPAATAAKAPRKAHRPPSVMLGAGVLAPR
ncbi:MAG TPA: hypothetical protein VE994_19645 [Terriglobales bacterium]|nr:hypothetical protein [Terriglobales bacterium]